MSDNLVPRIEVIMTRPRESTEIFLENWTFARNAEQNGSLHFTSLPLFEVHFINTDAFLECLSSRVYNAIILTSQNAVKAILSLENLPKIAHLKHVFCVGAETFKAAQDIGFERAKLHCSEGNIDALMRDVNAHDEKLSILFPSGTVVAARTEAHIAQSKHNINRLNVYDMLPCDLGELEKILGRPKTDKYTRIFTFFSPHAAQYFSDHLFHFVLKQDVAICLSSAVSSGLDSAQWAGIEVASHPSRQAMRDIIEKVCVRLL